MAKDNGFSELKTHIKENKLKNVYLFFGAENYIKEIYLKKIKEMLVDPSLADFNFVMLNEKSIDFPSVDDALESFPMMAEKKLVIIKNSGIFSKTSEDNKNFWLSRMKDLPEYVTLIFDETAVDKRSSIYKAVNTLGLPVEFEYLTDTDLIAWIEREARNAGKIISKNNAEYMVNICDSGLSFIKNELDKLLNFCDTEITLSDIERLVAKSLSVRVFELTDAIMEKNADKAITLLFDFKTVKESAFKILYLLLGTFDKMLHARLLSAEGAMYAEIVEKLGLKPFIVRKYIDNSKKFTENYLIDRIMRVSEIDLAIKEGAVDEWTALEQYVMESVEKV